MTHQAEEGLVLTSMEMNLCIRMLGGRIGREFPVFASERSVEEQMMNAFLRLTQSALVEAGPEGFRCSERMKALLAPVARPDRRIIAARSQEESLQVFQRDRERVLLEQVRTEGQSFRVLPVAEQALSELLPEEPAPPRTPLTPPEERFSLRSLPQRMLGQSLLLLEVRDYVPERRRRMFRVFRDGGTLWLSRLGESGGEVFPYTRDTLRQKLSERERTG